MQVNICEGDIVRSLKGHDEDRLYYVMSVINEDFLFLTDGRYRKLDNPKQKRIKHVSFVSKGTEGLTDDASVR